MRHPARSILGKPIVSRASLAYYFVGQPTEEKGCPDPAHGLHYMWAGLGQPTDQDGSAHGLAHNSPPWASLF
ncbi:hypothetical protein TorRG33x02_010510 [Trema orientale]|uniref:Uncharacterized protein n=1 Tax=Trema orientale TaxID=63057 RepID=A0A2P5FYW3_TREOI|nr:hypothetical protein TorRG33x02_010510 [Trema orientale]